MTNIVLSETLRDEMAIIFTGLKLKKPDGSYADISVYENDRPIPQEGDDADPDVVDMPYMVVRVQGGSTDSWDSPQIAKAVVFFCIYDNAPDRQGYKDGLVIINRILARFQKNPAIKSFVQTGKTSWMMSEEDNFPYFLGAVSLDFEIPKNIQEDSFA